MMKLHYFLITTIIMLFGINSVYAQDTSDKPEWAKKTGIIADGRKTSSYVEVYKIYAIGKDLAEETLRQKLIGKEHKILRLYEGEYVSPGRNYYFMVQICKGYQCQEWDEVITGTKYPFSARVFVPGMAQIYKGSKAKGGIIIGAEALGVGGIVLSYSMKASYERLISEDSKHKEDYNSQVDMWQNIGWGCIAFTAAVYIYNIIDGSVARGKEHVMLRPQKHNFAIAPMATPRGDVGLAARITF